MIEIANNQRIISRIAGLPVQHICFATGCLFVFIAMAVITSPAGISNEPGGPSASEAGFVRPSVPLAKSLPGTLDGISVSNLRAAAMKVNITPPIGMPLAGYTDRVEGSTGIRDPLRAGVLVLDDGSTRAAIVTMDLIDVGYEETRAIREATAKQAGVPDEHVLVAASHTHGSPRLEAGSDYGRLVIAKVAGAAAWAAARLRPVTFGYAEDEISFCVNRRLVNAEGIAEMKPNPDGIVDPRVKVLRFDDEASRPVAILLHVACHANVFRNENTQVTADFPGKAQQFVERAFGDAVPSLFLQGAAGNTRPNLPSDDGFRSGDESDLKWVGTELGATAVKAAARAGSRAWKRDTSYSIKAAVRSIELPGKEGKPVRIDLQALRVGPALFLTLPGEPFVEYGLHLERELTGRDPRIGHVFVVGYANGSIGYICTEASYRYGGYEPGVSPLAPEAESILLDELLRLAQQVL